MIQFGHEHIFSNWVVNQPPTRESCYESSEIIRWSGKKIVFLVCFLGTVSGESTMPQQVISSTVKTTLLAPIVWGIYPDLAFNMIHPTKDAVSFGFCFSGNPGCWPKSHVFWILWEYDSGNLQQPQPISPQMLMFTKTPQKNGTSKCCVSEFQSQGKWLFIYSLCFK